MTGPLRILLTNDDGIDSPGLLALERALGREMGVEVWTVAPDRGRSACGHGMTLTRPVLAEQAGKRRYALDGLPADCIYVALFGLLPDRPAVVISGINSGANLGLDVIYSGTVAGAREAVVRGVHGVSVSLVEGDGFDEVARNVCPLAIALARGPASPPLLLNLNYPGGRFGDPRLARLGERRYPLVVTKRERPFQGQEYYWIGGPEVEDGEVPGTDGWLIANGMASATLLTLEQTDHKAMAEAERLIPFLAAGCEGRAT